MSQSIDAATRTRSMMPAPQTITKPRRHVLTGVRLFTAAAVLTGVVLAAVEITSGAHDLYRVSAAVTSLFFGGLAGTVLCLRSMLASRQDFYRRGQLDGWMRGWRGQEPEVDDPILR